MQTKVLRVFPRRTSYTPEDDLVVVGDPPAGGEPPLFRPPELDRICVSCVFTWDKERCGALAEAWRARCPGVPVEVGGPGFDDPGGEFTPGMFVRHGISISSRGCPDRCPWCSVPRREGKLRLLPIVPGYMVQDNNVTAFPRAHFEALCRMLSRQSRAARLIGGLQAARLKPWHIERLRGLRIKDVWLAADHDDALPAVRCAARALALPRRKLRCYVLVGFDGETLPQAEARLEAVWDAGCLPFAQPYRDENGGPEYGPDWRKFVRTWSRPAAMFAAHRAAGTRS